jgi:hypothetical protein
VPAGPRKGHACQDIDLKQNNFKLASKKRAVSAVIAQKETPEVISITYL